MTLIDRDVLKKQMCKICNENYSDEPCEPNECVFRNAIDNAPTIDAVPVVRCKDCKSYARIIGKGDAAIFGCSYMGRDVKPDNFCSYGERRSE